MLSNDKDGEYNETVRLSMTLRGAPAKNLRHLRKRGIIRSYADGVNTAIQLLYDKTLAQDLRHARFRTFEENKDEGE